MRIGIDARLYSQTGVGRYLKNLIFELGLLDKQNEYFIYLRKEEFAAFIPPNTRWIKRLVDIKWHTIKEQILFPLILLRDRLDVVHFPYFNVAILYPGKYLLTIHDLIIDHFSTGRASTLPLFLYQIKRLGYKILTSVGIKRASFITAISKTTRDEIISHYHVDTSLVTVTHDALDNDFIRAAKNHKRKKYYDFAYLLFVGNAYPHKNLERLIEAFKLIRTKKKIKLVLAGDDDYFYPRLKDHIKKIGLFHEVIFFGHADDDELVNLYTYAKCLVFPSLMEGFGLPNLEALYCNILPVVSDIPVFREIWKNKLVYFDPYNINSISDATIKVLDFTSCQYQKKIDEAKKEMKEFSWKKTACETLKLYEKISCQL